MSSVSGSPMREPSPSLSPPPHWEFGTITVRIIIYVLNHAYPLVHAITLPVRRRFRLRDSMWFQEAISGDHRREMQLWQLKYEDWTTVNRNEVEIWVSKTSSTFILRLPHVWHCVGLGREIQAREDFLLQHLGILPVRPHDLCDIRVPRPEKIGDDFVVVVYPAMVDAPLSFVIRLELNGLIAIWDYPVLAQACFGCDSREDAVDIGIRVWNPQRARFDFYEAGEPLYAVEGYDFVLIRNEYNRHAPRLGKYIDQLEKQTIQGVFPTNIPFGDPADKATCDVCMGCDGSDSEESRRAEDDEDDTEEEYYYAWESEGVD